MRCGFRHRGVFDSSEERQRGLWTPQQNETIDSDKKHFTDSRILKCLLCFHNCSHNCDVTQNTVGTAACRAPVGPRFLMFLVSHVLDRTAQPSTAPH
jgi:hypothetical protein